MNSDFYRTPRTLHRDKWNPRERGHSLISMRTYYAFGARSASLNFPRSSSTMSSSNISSSYNIPPPFPSSNPYGMHSSQASSYRSSSSMLPKSSSITFPTLSNHLRSSPIFIKPKRPILSPPLERRSLRPLRSYIPDTIYRSVASPPRSDPPSRNNFLYSPDRLSRVNSPVSKPDLPISPRPSTSISTDHLATPRAYSSNTTRREEAVAESPPIRPTPTAPPVVPHADDSSEVPSPSAKADAIDMVPRSDYDSLLELNKQLEMEVARLKLQVQNGERTTREYKRKFLESEAEIKVWKAKAENAENAQATAAAAAQTTSARSATGDSLDSAVLFEQLDSAAEKLSKLSAVNDLKLLQSHMENAIMEITK